MSDVGLARKVRWPSRLVLSLVSVMEVFLAIRLLVEGDAGNTLIIVNSVGLVVSGVLVWRGVPWSRWMFTAFLVWRLTKIGVAIGSLYGSGDHRLGGTIMLGAIYLVCGAVIASPLGGPRKGTST